MAMHLKELRNDDLGRIHPARNIAHYQALVDKTMNIFHFP
jgi:hypothetical protein